MTSRHISWFNKVDQHNRVQKNLQCPQPPTGTHTCMYCTMLHSLIFHLVTNTITTCRCSRWVTRWVLYLTSFVYTLVVRSAESLRSDTSLSLFICWNFFSSRTIHRAATNMSTPWPASPNIRENRNGKLMTANGAEEPHHTHIVYSRNVHKLNKS